MNWMEHFFRWLWNTAAQVFGDLDQAFVTIGKRIVGAVASISYHLGWPSWVVTFVGMLLLPLAIVLIYSLFFAFVTWLERKVLGRIQNRYGPNRVGPYGLLQPIADGLKMLTKEDIVPRVADRCLHTLAPIVVVVPALMLFAVLPFGRNMIPADLNVAVLFFFAIGSMTTLALFMAGWGSRNKYSLLGAMRAIAQMISYELPVVLAVVPVVMIAGSLQVSALVAAQGPIESDTVLGTFRHWYIWKPWGLAGFIIFFIASMAELNRSPFDLPEGESEIIAGFHTEYSGFKFALFFLAEYLAAIASSGLAATLFLGGWWGPSFLPSWLWFFLKMFGLLCVMIWIRGTFPRIRVDQLMGFAWKFLLPLTFVNIVSAGIWFYLPRHSGSEKLFAWLASAAILFPIYLLLSRLNAGFALEKRVYRYANL